MKSARAIISIMRLPNVVIIILTMSLLRYGLIRPFLYGGESSMMSGWLDFSLIVLATVLITVAGYVINDMYDAGMDAINRPGKNRIGHEITSRSANLMYRILNAIAMGIAIYLGIRFRSATFLLIFPFAIFLLYLYSVKYKKTLAWGNIVVALLSSLTVFMVWYSEFLHLLLNPLAFSEVIISLRNVSVFFVLYAVFAFLLSFSREIIKDIEDRKGDEEFNCRTIAIVYGDRTAKFVAAGIMLVTILLIVWFQGILQNRGWSYVIWYFAIAVQLPLIYMIIKLFYTKKKEDLHFLSNMSKLVMLAGILSIQLIYSSL